MSAKKKINEYASELPIATPETAEALAISGGYSVKVPLSTFASKDNVKTISVALEKYKEGQGKKDAEQDRRLDKLESDVTTNALQEVSNGIDGEFVETIIGKKNEGQQTIGVSVTIQPISTASEDNRGVAESSDVRNFVNDSLEEIDNALEDIINGEINVNILTAGNGVNIANNVISADTTILATKKDIENIKPQQSEQVQSDWNVKDENSKAYIKNKPNLHNVATSGSYSDLVDKPTIPSEQVNSDWNATSGVSQILNRPTLHKVATSGSYNDLDNKPIIPSAQVNSDWDATSGVSAILNKPTLHAVATSGSYNDLKDKPTINTNFVPYSDNLDAISDDFGVAWMNVGEGREFGHIYKKEQGEGTYAEKTLFINQDIDAINVKAGVYERRGSAYDEPFWMVAYKNFADNKLIYVQCDGNFNEPYHTDTPKIIDEKIKIADYDAIEDAFSRGDEEYWHLVSDWEWHDRGEEKGGWKDVYDTSSNIPQLADVATSGDYADLANTPHLYVISCELKPTTSTDTDSYDAVMYFNILHNKDTITIDELKSMLLGKRHPATGYKGDDAIVSFVINQYNMSYRTISQENNALIGGFEVHGTYQVF